MNKKVKKALLALMWCLIIAVIAWTGYVASTPELTLIPALNTRGDAIIVLLAIVFGPAAGMRITVAALNRVNEK